MTSGNYQIAFKALGKWAKIFDLASADVTTMTDLLAITIDQIADGLPASLAENLAMLQFYQQLNGGINNGAAAIKSVAVAAASAYLTNSEFYGGLTTVPTDTSKAAAVLTALATEMTSVDSKTLTTKSGTGLVNFFDTISGTAGSWNTAGTGDYDDLVYVVDTIV